MINAPHPRPRFSLRALLFGTALASVVAFLLAPIGWLGGLYVTSLVFSTLMLALVLRGVRKRRTIGPVLTCALPMVTVFAMFVSPVALLHALLTAVVLVATHAWRDRRAPRAVACLAAMFAAYAGTLVQARQKLVEIRALRDQYPVVSLADRLPPTDQIARQTVGLVEAPVERLKERDSERDLQAARYWRSRRAWNLEMLHNRVTQRFVVSTGFGVGRMSGYYHIDEESLPLKPPRTNLPEYQAPAFSTDGNPLLAVQDALFDAFFSPESFGYIERHGHAAGFEPHGLRQTDLADRTSEEGSDKEREPWRVRRLQLVGLLRSTEPVVYIVDDLPSMDQLAGAPTRALDEFEAAALPSLATERDLVHEPHGDGVRMLGAIRAGADCLRCHDVHRGRLLGAFSYELVKVTPSTAGG